MLRYSCGICSLMAGRRGRCIHFLHLLMAKCDGLCSLRPYSSFATRKFHIIFEGIRTGHLH